MTLIKKKWFLFFAMYHIQLHFLSFCKFPFGANLGQKKISNKIGKNAQQHIYAF